MGFIWADYLLIVISIILIVLVLIQDSKSDAVSALSGEKSELFANKKERGLEVVLTRLTYIFSASFIVVAFIAKFIVSRGLLG